MNTVATDILQTHPTKSQQSAVEALLASFPSTTCLLTAVVTTLRGLEDYEGAKLLESLLEDMAEHEAESL